MRVMMMVMRGRGVGQEMIGRGEVWEAAIAFKFTITLKSFA